MNELLSDSLPDMDLTWIVRHLEKGECILLLGSDVDVVGLTCPQVWYHSLC